MQHVMKVQKHKYKFMIIGKGVYGLGKHIQQRLAVIVPDGPTDCNEVLKLRPAEPIRTSRENTCGIQAYLFRCELGCNAPHQWRWADLSKVWRMAMPKAATKPMHRALIAQPTAIVRPPPLTAESTSKFTSQHIP